MATPSPNGNPNSYFIARVRRALRDQVVWTTDPLNADGTKGTVAAGSSPFRAKRAPIVTGSVSLTTAAFPAGMTGAASWRPGYDSALAAPAAAPVLSDGGAGALPAGTYQVVVTYVDTNGVESPPSPLSNAQVIAVNHQLSVAGITGIPTSVATVRYYIYLNTASTAGFVASQAPVAGATGVQLLNAAGSGLVPFQVTQDTGELTFLVAPGAGALSVSYQFARYGDQQILDGLMEGMRYLYPDLWQPALDTTSIQYAPTTTEYALPAVFNTPRVHLLYVEAQPPAGILVSIPTGAWRRVALTTLVLAARVWPPGTILRLTYNAPYSALSDVDTDAIDIPIYYALYRVHLDQESMRSRQNDLVALTGEGATQPGASAQVAAQWKASFDAALQRLSLGPPHRMQIQQRGVEMIDSGAGFSWNRL